MPHSPPPPLSPAHAALVRSRLRWYLGLLGLLGLVPLLVTLTEPAFGWTARALAGLGLPLALAQLGLGLALPRVRSRRLVFGVLGATFVWLLGVGAELAAGDDRGLLVPWALFLVLPCVNAAMRADDVVGR